MRKHDSSELHAGAWAAGPFVVPVFLFAVAVGAAGAEAGLGLTANTFMNAVVFAGRSQIAALELWSAPLPIVPILLVTLALNVRLFVFGLTLGATARGLPARQRALTGFLVSDVNWAIGAQSQQSGGGAPSASFLIGAGALLWAIWQAGALAGFVVGSTAIDTRAFGLDAVAPALFAAGLVTVSDWGGKLVPVGLGAVAAVAALLLLPAGWHVVAAAIAAGAVAYGLPSDD